MPGIYLRGALVQLMPTFLRPLPNVIVFQYNPETMTHTWKQPESAVGAAVGSNPLAVHGLPGEEFSFTISMDALDMIADGTAVAGVIAAASGVYTRLAALEMLLFPPQAFAAGGLVGQVGASLLGRSKEFIPSHPVPNSQTPVVLFVWGPDRIVPVRVTQLTITEKLYDQLLNPTHAEASLGLRVLPPEELVAIDGGLALIAKAAYLYSQGLRQAMALTNLENSADPIIGMLPVG